MAKAFLDEDIYEGFLHPSTENLFYDMESIDSGQPFQSNFGGQIGTASRITTTAGRKMYSRAGLPTAAVSRGGVYLRSSGTNLPSTAINRPSTAIRPVGYTSEVGQMFDPLLQGQKPLGGRKSVIVNEKKPQQDPQEKYKMLEKKIQILVEDSILISTGPKPNYMLGLSKAKEAQSLHKTLLRLRDQNGATAYHTFEIMYLVLFNLANQYAKNKMFVEAIKTYSIMIKNKMLPNVNHLKINMGNIYYQMGIYSTAIKMYRMALDQVPSNQKELRLKITHNIGVLFVKMGQYSDAATSFEFIMSDRADIKSGMHLVLCYYAMGDAEKMKKGFRALVELSSASGSAAFIDDTDDEVKIQTDLEDDSQTNQHVYEIIKSDEMAKYIEQKRKSARKAIMMLADLISGVIEENYNDGYTWCIEIIKSSNFTSLANELELNKALVYLRQNDIPQAIETLKFYEKNDPSIAANAMTNLIFIYIFLGDYENATRYAERCRKMDSYNPAAFINSGVCELLKGDLEMAKNYLESALEIDITSFEATFNLGLVHKRMGDIETASSYFEKINLNLSHSKHPHILYQMAKLEEQSSDSSAALDWYLQLLGTSQEMDPGIYQKVGELYEATSDRKEANQYYNEAFRINPSDLKTASNIGSYFIQLQTAEKAIYYYERAALANPNEPNSMLRVAGCFRNIFSPKKYLQLFEKIYARFPENLNCLRALIHVTQTHGMTDLNEKYTTEFGRIEKILQSRQRTGSSRSGTKTPQRRDGSTGKLSRGSSGTNSDISSAKSSKKSFGRSSATGREPSIAEKDYSIISNYSDPLGPAPERPRTGVRNGFSTNDSDEELDAEELLPM